MNTSSTKTKTIRTASLLCALGCGVLPFTPLVTHAIAAPEEAPEPAVVYTDANDGETVEAQVGDVFEVHLESNASTGYSWSIASQDEEIIEAVGKPKYVRPAGARPGAPGLQKFQFKAKGAGETKLVLHYKRPWEKDTEPAKVFTLSLEITEKE